MSEENHDALESDSAIESPMKIPKKTHSRLSVALFSLLQRKWYLSAKIRFYQLDKLIFFNVSCYDNTKSVVLSNVVSYLL